MKLAHAAHFLLEVGNSELSMRNFICKQRDLASGGHEGDFCHKSGIRLDEVTVQAGVFSGLR